MILKGRNVSIFISCLLFLVLLCLFPNSAKKAVLEGLQVCGCSVIPALFPFFIVSKLLLQAIKDVQPPKWLCRFMEGFFGVEGACATPLLMSFLGGYPVGVSCVVSQYKSGNIVKSSAERALLFCNNSGPGFFIGMVGASVLGNIRLGLLLYLIHIISAMIVGRLLAKRTAGGVNIRRIPVSGESFSKQFIDAVSESCGTLLNICGFILFFSLLMALIEAIGAFRFLEKSCNIAQKEELSAIVYGSLELTGGILRLKNCCNAFPIAAFLMGWGGICVHFQAMSLWHTAGLRPKGYFPAKLLQAGISAIIASTFLAPNTVKLLVLALILCTSVFLPQIRKKSSGNFAHFAV